MNILVGKGIVQYISAIRSEIVNSEIKFRLKENGRDALCAGIKTGKLAKMAKDNAIKCRNIFDEALFAFSVAPRVIIW